MATYQFLLFVLPKKIIKREYGKIPKQLEIKHEEWEKYWDNYDFKKNIPEEYSFEDAISKPWWINIPIDIKKLRKDIDNIIPRASWNNKSWKKENGIVDHDLSIDWNDNHNYIEDFRFRVDLRDNDINFLKSMLILCHKNDWILMDDKGNLSDPNINDLKALILDSNAYNFISNPIRFFEQIDNKSRN